MPRIGLFLILSIPLLAQGCVTFSFPSGQAQGDLEAMARPGYPAFRGLARFTMAGLRGNFSGGIMMAMEGEKFRLEITDATGRTVQATAWNGNRLYKLDLATGVKAPAQEGIFLDAPIPLARTMVTGAPPGYGSVTSTWKKGGLKVARVAPSGMELSYKEGKLVKVEGGGLGEGWSLLLGPFKNGPMAPYVESATLSAVGASVSIQWVRVEQGMEFPPGYFLFEEISLDLDQW